MKTKASLLTLLTVSTTEHEDIIFAYLKEVCDNPPAEIYWYPKKGGNGEAEFIWKEKRLKQWLLIGRDEDVINIWNSFQSKSEISFHWEEKTVRFNMPSLQKETISEDFIKIKDIEVCNAKERPVEFKRTSPSFDISYLFNENNNCSFIEGYQIHENIKSLIPLGILPKGWLSKYLNQNIVAILEKRGIFYHFRGDRSSMIAGDPIRYSGFVQTIPEIRNGLRLCIRNLEGTKILGTSDIDSQTGKWTIDLSEPTGKGQILFQNKQNGQYVCGEKYYLIKEISIKSHFIHTVFTDLFGRKINLSTESNPTRLVNKSIIWDSSAAPTSLQSEIELSDRLTDTILSLGPNLIFSDPYFFGDIKENDSSLMTTKSQLIFLNALITAIAKGNIESMAILGYWNRAKNFIHGDKTQLVNKYKLIYKLIAQTFNNSNLLNIKKLEIVMSKEPMHDRYWLGGDVIYSVSNSINGMFESGELFITEETTSNKFKLQARIQRRYENGDKFNLM
jgi:hypothetical protein